MLADKGFAVHSSSVCARHLKWQSLAHGGRSGAAEQSGTRLRLKFDESYTDQRLQSVHLERRTVLGCGLS